jgi:hypothetical protein
LRLPGLAPSLLQLALLLDPLLPEKRAFGQPRDRCYDFLNIFAEKFGEKIGVFN